MRLYTIGFTQKTAETFFELLRQNGVRRVIDIRLKPGGQLAGFAKQSDLPYFLNKLVEGCEYLHMSELAPTEEILQDYRKDHHWERYAQRFEALMDERKVLESLRQEDFERKPSCFLCSEPTAEKCHRRLVVERLAARWRNVEIVHL